MTPSTREGDAPPTGGGAAFVPRWLEGTRAHGVSLQLYQLRSPRNFGVGDLGDLCALIAPFARWGADFIGLNPVHALFTADPERASPFSPSDRRFFNPLIIAVDAVPGFRPQMLEAVNIPPAHEMVDYTAATAAKLAVLHKIHALWQAGDAAVPEAAQRAARQHARNGGKALAAFALFEALSHHMVRAGHGAGWAGWPAPYQAIGAPAVQAFAAAHAAEISFHAWLQHIAEKQLSEVHQAALSAGMRIGLYLDIAIGTVPDGAATWAEPDLAMRGVSIGAPPDVFSPEGQDWNLAPLAPTALVERDFAPYDDVLAAAMGHAGAVRLDHAIGLEQLFLVPAGRPPEGGAHHPQTGLIERLITASHAQKTLVIGDDIGVPPTGFRERMAARRIFSTRILLFEHDRFKLRRPQDYPRDALACLSTHDLAPLAALWRADDVAVRLKLGRLSARAARRERGIRFAGKQAILAMAGLSRLRALGPPSDRVVVAAHRLVATTAARLMAVRLEDVVGGRRLVNLPGTDREHPNWRCTLPLTVDEIAKSPRLHAVMQAVAEERPKV
ncbi:MAG: 4-alpha-glucanotransferase [Pseudomonadota bacterium]